MLRVRPKATHPPPNVPQSCQNVPHLPCPGPYNARKLRAKLAKLNSIGWRHRQVTDLTLSHRSLRFDRTVSNLSEPHATGARCKGRAGRAQVLPPVPAGGTRAQGAGRTPLARCSGHRVCKICIMRDHEKCGMAASKAPHSTPPRLSSPVCAVLPKLDNFIPFVQPSAGIMHGFVTNLE